MGAMAGRSRGRSLVLLLLCLAVVAGLLLVQRGTDAAERGQRAEATAVAADSSDSVPTATLEDAAAAQTPDSGLPVVAESDLPGEAHDTLDLIRSGGPYPYRQDDETFGNREGILPDRPRGYYREYTVRTRGSPDRGARRIVAGADGDLYYTADHYGSFEQIEETR